MHIILTGATGTVGSAVLTSLLSSPTVSQLSILSRRQFDLPTGDNLDLKKAKIIVHKDYVSYPDELLKGALDGAQGCVWAQGISQTEVNKE
jgi:malate/lactate dehydrogenase